MTDQQIELEFMHILLDEEALKQGKQQYEDKDYDDYDKETEDTDNKLSYAYDAFVEPASEEQGTEEEDWEDVEIDGFEEA